MADENINNEVVPVDTPPKEGDGKEEQVQSKNISGKVIANPTEL